MWNKALNQLTFTLDKWQNCTLLENMKKSKNFPKFLKKHYEALKSFGEKLFEATWIFFTNFIIDEQVIYNFYY